MFNCELSVLFIYFQLKTSSHSTVLKTYTIRKQELASNQLWEYNQQRFKVSMRKSSLWTRKSKKRWNKNKRLSDGCLWRSEKVSLLGPRKLRKYFYKNQLEAVWLNSLHLFVFTRDVFRTLALHRKSESFEGDLGLRVWRSGWKCFQEIWSIIDWRRPHKKGSNGH